MMSPSRLQNSTASPPRARRLTLAVVLAALLLLSQGLGLLHRVQHAPPGSVATLASAGTSVGLQAQPAGHGLFGTHEAGDADCRLLDQLAHADALLAAALPLLAGLPPARVAVRAPDEAWRRHEACYLARAPPAA